MIYFIAAGESGPVKIGYSKSLSGVDGRLRGLQTGNPDELYVVGVIEGTPADEQAIHTTLSSSQLRGEWFKRDAALIMYGACLVTELEG